MSERFQYSTNVDGQGMSVKKKLMSMGRYLPTVAMGAASLGALAIQVPDTVSWLGVARNAFISGVLTYKIIDVAYFDEESKGRIGQTISLVISTGSGIATGIVSAQHGVGPGMLLPVGEGIALLGFMSKSLLMRLQSPRD